LGQQVLRGCDSGSYIRCALRRTGGLWESRMAGAALPLCNQPPAASCRTVPWTVAGACGPAIA
jgi:hypothetical protein